MDEQLQLTKSEVLLLDLIGELAVKDIKKKQGDLGQYAIDGNAVSVSDVLELVKKIIENSSDFLYKIDETKC